jgi:transcriptional regulator with XRE-family HTH domain
MAEDPRDALADFLRTRRTRVTPRDVGLEPGGRRRVAGLRREELALLAGVSPDYYQRMEQGRDVRPSEQVLDAIARALNFTDEEARHLHKLATAARTPNRAEHEHAPEAVPETTLRLLRTMTAPAISSSAGSSTCSPGARWPAPSSASSPRSRGPSATCSTCSCTPTPTGPALIAPPPSPN